MSKRSVLIAVLLVGTIGVAQRAEAVPVLGGQLFYTGGNVTVSALPVSSGFSSVLGLYDPSFNLLLSLTTDEPSFPAQPAITFNPTAYGIAVGNELIFGVHINDTGFKFFIGPASRNPDNVFHATVDSIGGGQYVVGFEDLFGGGDRDYDDNRFLFTGAVSASPVPEPGTLSLLLLGFIPVARRRMARSK
jgi:hypothetical protein